MRGFIWGAACAALTGGCVGESEARHDAGPTRDSLVLDTAAETTAEAGDTDGEAPAIVSFTSDHTTITHGVDGRGVAIAGSATLAWRTRGAAEVALLVDGLPIALDGCLTSGGGTCADAGGIVVRPASTTTFTLEARGPDGRCDGPCPSAAVTVAVAAPAIVRLEAGAPIVSAGGDAAAAYRATAATFEIGLTAFDEDGARTFAPCAPVSQADAGAPCTISDDGSGAPLDEGLVVVAGVERDVTFAARATNGADDGLGDVALGDVLASVTVPVEIGAFTATPAKALPGASVVLAWRVRGAHALAVSAGSDALVGLSTCVGIGEGGAGFCTITLDADAPLGVITFELVGTQDTGTQGKARAEVEVVAGPTITRADLSPDVVVPGQAAAIDFEAFAVEALSVTAVPDVIDAECDLPGADGGARCELVARAGAAPGPVAVTLTASHGEVGPPATTTFELGVLAGPVVHAFAVDDDTVVAGARLALTWRTEHATFVELAEDSGAIAPAALGGCSSVSGLDGGGACTLALPAGLPPGAITLRLTAVGPTGARSEASPLVLTLGKPPAPTLTATPTHLPEGGGEVTLNWTATTASRVVVTDDGMEPDTIVDTDEGTVCEGAAPCAPAGDRIALVVVQPSVLTLVATNDFGSGVASVSVSIEGAPEIIALRLDGLDVIGASSIVPGAEGTLTWEVAGVAATDELRLERAPPPAAHAPCTTVAQETWSAVAAFPRAGSATGSATIPGLTATAECFRFTAEDLGSTPTQRASAVFKVRKAPELTGPTVDDDTRQPGDTVTLDWSTRHAYGVVLTVAPVGAVTTQDLAGCTAPAGPCTVVLQPGAPLGDVTFTLFAYGEEGAETPAAARAVTLGVGARIESFTASPGTASSAVDVELAWRTIGGARLTIDDGTSSILTTSEAAAIDVGELTARATATTTWTLTVDNAFGGASGQVTAFIGPSIDALTANGGNALDGAESVVTGPVTVAWTTTSAGGTQRLQRVKSPANGACATAGLAWVTVYEDLASPPASASHALGTVLDNTCVRLVVTNTETPPQSSTATFLLREVPAVASFATTPDTLPSSGGTVIVDVGARGATALTLTAQYRAADGEVLGTRAVCDQGSLNSGALDGGADVDEVACAHTITPCNLLCLNNGMPAGTKTVRYLLALGDAEGDGASATTAGGQDVSLP